VTPDPSAVPIVVWIGGQAGDVVAGLPDVMTLGIFAVVIVGIVAVFGIFLGAAAKAFRS